MAVLALFCLGSGGLGEEPAAKRPDARESRSPGEIKVGDQVYIHVPVRRTVAICAVNECAYRYLLITVKQHRLGFDRNLWAEICFLHAGRRGKVVALRDKESFALQVPAAEVLLDSDKNSTHTFWVPIQYLRERGDPKLPGELTLPVIIPYTIPYLPREGETVGLYSLGRGQVFLARNLEDCVEVILRDDANDFERLRQLTKKGVVIESEEAVLAEVITARAVRVGNRFRHVVECKVTSGNLKDRTGWVSAYQTRPITDKARRISGISVCAKWMSKAEMDAANAQPEELTRACFYPELANHLLFDARGLEKSRQPDDALGCYEQIVHHYPDSPEGKIAAERIRVLTTPKKGKQAPHGRR
jgi:hypothetical protein